VIENLKKDFDFWGELNKTDSAMRGDGVWVWVGVAVSSLLFTRGSQAGGTRNSHDLGACFNATVVDSLARALTNRAHALPFAPGSVDSSAPLSS